MEKEFDIEEYHREIKGSLLGRNMVYRDVIGSTNDLAMELASGGCAEGTVVIAGKQVKSRGRMGREWLSPDGGLWFSLILRPKVPDVRPLTLIFGASVSKSIEELTSIPCGFHWTNDIYMNDRKLGGILMESRFMGDKLKYIVAGIGINLNFHGAELGENLAAEPTTLLDEAGKYFHPPKVLSVIMQNLESDYHDFIRKGSADLIDRYKNRCITLNRRVQIIRDMKNAEEGVALDITPDGGLLVRLDRGDEQALYSVDRLILREKL